MSLTQKPVSADLHEVHANAFSYGLRFPETSRFAEEFDVETEDLHYPTRNYLSPEVLKDELEQLWYRCWQVACREDQVPNPGDYLEYEIGDQSFLVVRGEDGVLRAFYNACRHRGTALKRGTGNAKDLTCTFHAWCWNLKGGLQEIPERQLYPTVDDQAYGLKEAGCDTFGGWVWIHPRPEEAQSLSDFLAPMNDLLGRYHMDKFRTAVHAAVEVRCNWKVAIEAFIEAIHTAATHPQILAMHDEINTKFELLGRHSRMITPYGVPSMSMEHVAGDETWEAYFQRSVNGFRHVEAAKLRGDDLSVPPPELFDEETGEWRGEVPLRDYLEDLNVRLGRDLGHDYSELSADERIDLYDYFLFPHLKLNMYAGAALGFRARPHATDPDRCYFDIYKLAWGDENAAEQPPAAPTVEVDPDVRPTPLGQVLDQDFENMPKIQVGLHSRSLEHITMGKGEVRVVHLHKMIEEFMASASTQAS